MLLYAYDFILKSSFFNDEDKLISGFLSAINAFSQKVFAGFIDYIKIEQHQIILKFVESFYFYFVFDGELVNAINRLTEIISGMKADTELWDTLKTNSERGVLTIEQEKLNKISNIVNKPIESFL